MKFVEKDPKNVKVLIVDDNSESLNVITYFLKPVGYQLITAADGVQALEYINKELPDIVLLDVMMPKLNGFQVCERLKKDERTFHIPIIMITALKELKDKIRALEAGADDFITKPFESVELLTRVKSLLRIKFFAEKLQRQNRELVQQKRALENDDKLKEKLTDLIVHDMKNPLFIIQGSAQMMSIMRNSGMPVDSEKYAKRIENSSRSLLRMILSLLDVSRLEHDPSYLNPSLIRLEEMIYASLKYFKELPENKKKEISVEIAENLPRIFVDVEIFERVLDNLFDFVFKHASERSKVTIRAKNGGEDHVILFVGHEGECIPELFRQKMFSKTAQLELKDANIQRGKGLGLLFCKMAVEANRGTIEIDPVYNDGTRFVLKIPTGKKAKTSLKSVATTA